ncbi:MAG: GDCCVxC domain-containing (seleno)protein [Candidatus Micrarchaeia archaeon]
MTVVSTTLICPHCKKGDEVKIAENVCLHFHKCLHCGKIIHAPPGSCCVICAYTKKRCAVSIKSEKNGKVKPRFVGEDVNEMGKARFEKSQTEL